MFETRTVLDVDLPSVKQAVGGGSYAKGSQQSWRDAVRDIGWEPDTAVLCGTVCGEGDPPYEVEAAFVPDSWPARFAGSRCGCMAGGACRHVVALICAVVHASTIDLAAAVPPARRTGSWDNPPPRRRSAAAVPPAVQLAIEVEVRLDSGPCHAPRLVARVVERIPGGEWIHGQLTFGTVGTAGHRDGYPAPQVGLLGELCALYLAEGRDLEGGAERLVDLSAIESDRLWDLLKQARELNLALVEAKTGEEIPAHQEGRFHLDIVAPRPAGGYRMTPTVLVGQERVQPVAFIGGKQAHGVVCRSLAQAGDQPGDRRLRLVRLERPVPAGQLQEHALDGRPQEIRAGEEFAFRTRHYPWLRDHADVISSDDSFHPPVISAPTLVLFLHSGSDGELDLRWGWDYEIDGQRLSS